MLLEVSGRYLGAEEEKIGGFWVVRHSARMDWVKISTYPYRTNARGWINIRNCSFRTSVMRQKRVHGQQTVAIAVALEPNEGITI